MEGIGAHVIPAFFRVGRISSVDRLLLGSTFSIIRYKSDLVFRNERRTSAACEIQQPK